MILTQRQNLVSIRDYSLRLLQTKTLVEIEDQCWVNFTVTLISKLDLDFWPNLDFTAKSLHCRAIEVLEKEWQLFSLSLNMQVQCPSEQKKLHPCINNQRNLLHKASYVQITRAAWTLAERYDQTQKIRRIVYIEISRELSGADTPSLANCNFIFSGSSVFT